MAPTLVVFTLASWFVSTSSATSSSAFLVMGDWGGSEKNPYYTASEVDTADGMNTVAKALGANFALALGDNMYHYGVTCVEDRRFNTTFENVFTGDALSAKNGFQFHILAGNHDHYGNISAQLAYSNVSPRWVYPSLYYTFTKSFEDNATVQFVMIDTVILAGNSQVEGETEQLPGSALPGPADKAASDQQLVWLEQTLSESKADYLIVAGHFPVYSVCEHGPTPLLQNVVKPLLLKYKASAYFAGHDHCAEHIDVGDGVQYHGIGSAAYHDTSLVHKGTVSPDQLKFHDANAGGGFAAMVVSKSHMHITHHDDNGKELYNADLAPRSMDSLGSVVV